MSSSLQSTNKILIARNKGMVNEDISLLLNRKDCDQVLQNPIEPETFEVLPEKFLSPVHYD